MIRMNLLPWRETKIRKMRRVLILQLLLAVIFPSLAVAAYRIIETSRLTHKIQSIEAYRQVNQPVLIKIERLDAGFYLSGIQQLKHQRLKHIINQRNKLPGILEMLTAQERKGRINKLVLDHHSLKIIYSTSGIDDTLPLFQLLNSYPLFCQVSFDPVAGQAIPAQSADTGGSSYELNAKLCDSTLY